EVGAGVVVIGDQPIAMLLHDIGGPVAEELRRLEIGLVALLDARGRGGAELHFDHTFPSLAPLRAGELSAAAASVDSPSRLLSHRKPALRSTESRSRSRPHVR